MHQESVAVKTIEWIKQCGWHVVVVVKVELEELRWRFIVCCSCCFCIVFLPLFLSVSSLRTLSCPSFLQWFVSWSSVLLSLGTFVAATLVRYKSVETCVPNQAARRICARSWATVRAADRCTRTRVNQEWAAPARSRSTCAGSRTTCCDYRSRTQERHSAYDASERNDDRWRHANRTKEHPRTAAG